MNFMILCSGISGILATPICELKLHRSLEEREESKSASEDELKALEEARGQGPELSWIHMNHWSSIEHQFLVENTRKSRNLGMKRPNFAILPAFSHDFPAGKAERTSKSLAFETTACGLPLSAGHEPSWARHGTKHLPTAAGFRSSTVCTLQLN